MDNHEGFLSRSQLEKEFWVGSRHVCHPRVFINHLLLTNLLTYALSLVYTSLNICRHWRIMGHRSVSRRPHTLPSVRRPYHRVVVEKREGTSGPGLTPVIWERNEETSFEVKKSPYWNPVSPDSGRRRGFRDETGLRTPIKVV